MHACVDVWLGAKKGDCVPQGEDRDGTGMNTQWRTYSGQYH